MKNMKDKQIQLVPENTFMTLSQGNILKMRNTRLIYDEILEFCQGQYKLKSREELMAERQSCQHSICCPHITLVIC